MLRSLENFVSKTCSYSFDLFVKTAEKAKEELATKGSKLLAYTFLYLALQGAIGLSPIAGKFDGIKWVQEVRVMMETLLDKAKKVE